MINLHFRRKRLLSPSVIVIFSIGQVGFDSRSILRGQPVYAIFESGGKLITKHLMTGSSGNSEFCFPSTSMFPSVGSVGFCSKNRVLCFWASPMKPLFSKLCSAGGIMLKSCQTKMALPRHPPLARPIRQ